MMTHRNFITSAVLIVFVFAMSETSAWAEMPVRQGDQFTLSVFLNKETEIEGVDMIIRFDEKLLTFTDAVVSSKISENPEYGYTLEEGLTGGELTLRIVAYKNLFTGIEMADIHFTAKDLPGAIATVSVSDIKCNEDPAIPGGFYINGSLQNSVKVKITGTAELRHAIAALQIAAGFTDVKLYFDIDGDGKTGLGDAVFILQAVAEIRPQPWAE